MSLSDIPISGLWNGTQKKFFLTAKGISTMDVKTQFDGQLLLIEDPGDIQCYCPSYLPLPSDWGKLVQYFNVQKVENGKKNRVLPPSAFRSMLGGKHSFFLGPFPKFNKS